MRRALGFKLDHHRAGTLMSFVEFCEDRDPPSTLTTDLAMEWATRTTRGSDDEVYQARRLDVVRIFARHLQALDPATEVPPVGRAVTAVSGGSSPTCTHRQEITALMNAAEDLAPAHAGGDLADADRPAGRDRHASRERPAASAATTSTWTTGR